MEKVSLIIPMFNEERNVERGISAIKNQTYENLEIIVIDDGSEDASVDIVRRQADSRFILIEKAKNEGVSAARNAGLDRATGRYIAFPDMDDCVRSDYVERLVEAIQNSGSQLVVCGYEKFDKTGLITGGHRDERSFKKGDLSPYEFARDMIKQEGLKSSLWNKLFVRELIGDLRFSSEISVGEDLLFNLEYAKRIKKVHVIEDTLYGYFVNPDGVMSRILACEEFDEKWLSEWDMIKRYLKSIKSMPEFEGSAGELGFYRMLIIAHKLYYRLLDTGYSSKRADAARAQMEEILFNQKRKIAANSYINPKWKLKLLLGKR